MQLMEADPGCNDHDRFKAELEFIQGLASPHYINWLAQNRYFEDPAFITYLEYLKYWQRPEYSTFIIYPHCLQFLELLRSKAFRNQMAISDAKELLHRQQLYFYQHYRNNRLKQTSGEVLSSSPIMKLESTKVSKSGTIGAE